MAKDLKSPEKKGKAKSKLLTRLLLPMLMVVAFQLIAFFAILILGGEFNYVRQYSYDTFTKKTSNRTSYIEAEFQQKSPIVRETAELIDGYITELLAERGESIGDIEKDRELNELIMEVSLDSLIDMLRRSMANDVYLILDTGKLYGGNAKAALYLRDPDTNKDAGYSDVMMEAGSSSISQSYGITPDPNWTEHFEADPEDTANYDFFYTAIQNAKKNPSLGLEELGYWSGFSRLSGRGSASLKYTVPMISENGAVYGVLGIGLTEDAVLSQLPADDFDTETACYVLGRGIEENEFDIIAHSGDPYTWLVGDIGTLKTGDEIAVDICDFPHQADVALAGSVQYIRLYNENSPYYSEQWALISVADRGTVLRQFTGMVQMLLISAAVSLAISVVVVFLSARKVVSPISDACIIMNNKSEFSQVLRFPPSNIYELDQLTDAITQLQINVQDFSSQVSQMIRIADMGLGTFMYDHNDDSMFVGQSLFKMMRFQTYYSEDALMSRKDFLNSIMAPENKRAVTEALELAPESPNAEYTKEYTVKQEDGSTIWMRLNMVHNKNKSIGIMQDITKSVIEKKRIEHERDYDSTTGLLNRSAYYRALEDLFSDREALKTAAFLMIDLDNLKYVNDTYGHDFGDDYIRTAASNLKKFQSHGGVVARLSGDEFNVFLSGFSSKDEIRRVIDEVRGELLDSYCLLADGTHYNIRASAGISWFPDDGSTYETLMKYADFAMYTVKHGTKGEIAEFDKSAYEKDALLVTSAEEMNRIIDECSVRYAFHGIVSAKTGEIYGYEALMRPQSTIFQSPEELLRIAKTNSKLNEIETMTWKKALADFQAQIDEGNIPSGSHIFINSIPNSVMSAGDADVLEETYSGLLTKVVLEILESEHINEEYNTRKAERMKKWGAQIALDDFGTGYNSEYALITLHPDIIKIDRSIINGCDKDISRRMIISNLVKLVKTKNILVLAEGVETDEELHTVISCGVDLLQGYYITRPVFEPCPPDERIVDIIRRFAGAEEQLTVDN